MYDWNSGFVRLIRVGEDDQLASARTRPEFFLKVIFTGIILTALQDNSKSGKLERHLCMLLKG